MQQILLPLELPDTMTTPGPAPAPVPVPVRRKGRGKKCPDDRGSSEETMFETLAGAAAAPSAPRGALGVARELPFLAAVARPWPAALSWDDALVYTSLSEVELRRGVRRGIVKFMCVGPRGRRVARRDQLDRLISAVFGPEPVGVEEDFDFG